jgi:UDP-N-acetyl-D-galactosamine dehydrogenase
MIAAVAHREFLKTAMPTLAQKVTRGGCFVDVKSAFDVTALRQAGLCVWRL